MKKRICIAQIGFTPDIGRHIRKIKNIITQNKEADLVVFPELILHGHPSVDKPEGYLYRRIKKYYDALDDKSDDLYKFVKSNDARVIIGELKGTPEGFYNTATYIDRDRTESYMKAHVHWTENFVPGRMLKVFTTPLGRVGITICFDSAFPEVWRVLSLKGADIIVNISAVPRTFPVKYMCRRLEGAAINNQVFIVYANRPGSFFSGNSAVYDPRGETVVRAEGKESVIHAEIDLGAIKKWRGEEQLYQHRQPLLYRDIVKQHGMWPPQVSGRRRKANGRE